MPKIEEIVKKPPEELSEIEFWVILIMAGEKKRARDLLAKLVRKEEMRMAQALLNTMSRNSREWEIQYGYERFVHDCISREKYAFSRGEEQGGRNARFETARRMLASRLGTIEQIADITQLPISEISQLK